MRLCVQSVAAIPLLAGASREHFGAFSAGRYVACSMHTSPAWGMGGSGGSEKTWFHSPNHHLHASVGRHSTFSTACGRIFDPNIYFEMVQACMDQQWAQAVQRGVMEDKEYVQMLRTEGGTIPAVNRLMRGVQDDDQLMIKLRQALTTDRKMSLSLCALQDAYMKIRKKRDAHETVSTAEGASPVAEMHHNLKQPFGQQHPMRSSGGGGSQP